MKKTAIIFALLLFVITGWAQVTFKTIVSQEPLVSGESFQVQYVIEDVEKTMAIKPPVFNNFRFVAGPNIYKGSVSSVNGVRPIKNAVYTLEAMKPGTFIVPGATVMINGKVFRSNDVLVKVISKEDAFKKFNKDTGINPSDYFLRPGENPYEKIKQNLFVKVLVDRKNCFVGEPVLATFKLYSRLESKSDIVKNPGFYGFTVYDMVNLADKQVVTEKMNGKTYDVHTIRKVQLYPLQAGIFTIDAMEVKNKVEFSKSGINRKTEQEIVEGVLGNNDKETMEEGTDVFETSISTVPIAINVNPVPEKNQPPDYNGATGRFTIAASLAKNNLSKNEEGLLEITISGKGNFIQLSAPSIQWPAGAEPLEPGVKDNFDKTTSPLTGSRTFNYSFVCTVAGTYQIPQVNFSFFDTDSNKFKTVTTKNIEVLVINEEKKHLVVAEQKTSIAEKSENAARKAGIIVVLLVLVILLYWIFRKKETENQAQTTAITAQPSVENLLEPAYADISSEGNQFYSTLRSIIWKYVAGQFFLSGSEMNKHTLIIKMNEANLHETCSDRLFRILEECEAGMFTNASLLHDRQGMLSETMKVLEDIRIALL
jgi:BatD DUF11 like domain